MEKLYLLKMGMDDKELLHDVKNHRVRVIERINTTLRNESMFFEFMECAVRKVRSTHKITGRELKHPIVEIVNSCGLCIDTEYETEKGCYRDSKIEKEVWDSAMDYSKESILKVVNSISLVKYSSIAFIDEEAKKIAVSLGGFRESEILKNDPIFRASETWTEQHKVVEVFERVNHKLGNSFEVDLVTKKIVG